MTTPTHSVLLNSGSGSSVANLMGGGGERGGERGGGRGMILEVTYLIVGVVKWAWLPQALERYILPWSLVPSKEHCHLKGRDL